MAHFYLTKQPLEETTFAVDMGGFRELQLSESISSISVKCTLDGAVTTGIIVSSGFAGSVVSVRVKSGDDGERYLISILATTSGGHKREVDVLLEIKERE